MEITEKIKQTRQKGPEPRRLISPHKSDAQVTGEKFADAESQDRVDQVREILFGAQREEYDRRFNRLEELLVKSTSDLSNDTAKKFGALKDEYDKRFARLEELLAKNISDLSNDTAKKFSALKDEYDKALTKKASDLSDNINDLRHEKVDKSTITKLLGEVMKLSSDIKLAMSEKSRDE